MKTIITLIMLIVAVATSNAQYFVEWSIGMSYNDALVSEGNIVQNKKMSYDIHYAVSPLVGYQLNDNIAIGTKAAFFTKISNRKIYEDENDPESEIDFETRRPSWNFAVFGRNKLWGTEKVSFLIESSVFIGKSRTEEKTGTIKQKTDFRSSFGINAVPLVTYNLSEKFTIIATCNFLSLSLSTATVKNELDDFKVKYNYFGFDSQSTFFNYLSGIKLGFIYNF